jgi:hypothetical protein
MAGGANHVSLVDGQRNFAAIGACEGRFAGQVRRPSEADLREATWRPIDPERDRFEDTDPLRRPLEHDERLYYWRSTFWRNSTQV